ncbi:hypothetical protein LUZ63_017052 [Rhynchospora breviuscula]|uniref:Probable magnesium transporter n=1 Tax=Rhynchospora breviuscula TaxID=2022672 RepID=A0A9Q0HF03_9POAL|nr:hypothetical protein LUZ63_017052 [Rhynchospora breviuscula]
MGMSSDNSTGLALAVSSSFFIGSSFVIKKVGHRKAAHSGMRAGSGGFSYLHEPLWWVGMITMIGGEIANFAAYAFAPAILVTPMGALSIIVSAVLAHCVLNEKLKKPGWIGCILCIVGSAIIALHAPKEREIESVKQIWHYATQPGFLVYCCIVLIIVLVLIFRVAPRYGQKQMLVYITICSLMGSLTVMSAKAFGIALKLSVLSRRNQFIYFQTWFFIFVVIGFVVIQLIYLNKALDTFNTAIVSPVYYVLFTIFTILASMIMLKEWHVESGTQISTEILGFIVIILGTFLLNSKESDKSTPSELTNLNGSEASDSLTQLP